MSTFLVIMAVLAVAAVLGMGLFNMMKGGSSVRSQQLMRWRVGLQAIAIAVIMLVIWVSKSGS